jgi:outer membrane protein assembly factor BamB
VSPNADSAPIEIARVALPSGKHRALVYVLAGNNTDDCNPGNPVRRTTLYAFDAATGAQRWSRSTTGPSRCTTASPVAVGQWVYAPGLDGKVHRYAAATGKEYTRGGWPRTYTLMPDVEKSSADLTATQRYLYVTTSGFIGDQGHYQGHLLTIDLKTGKTHIFNTLCSNIHVLLGPTPGSANYCSDVRSGLFGRGEGVVDPVTHDVYIVSGNGPWNGQTNWGDSVLKLNPAGSKLLDAFTPTNQAPLDAQDADLGSTGPALLPPVRQGGHVYHLLVQGGKGPTCDSCGGAAIRLLNRDNLSGRGGPGHLGGDLFDTQSPGGNEVLTAPAVWKAPGGALWVFYANDSGIAGYRLTSPSNGTFRLDRVWQSRRGATTPILSGGVLWAAGGGSLTAYNPATGAILAQTSIGSLHWEYPLVAGHRIYLTDESGRISAYSTH